MNNSFKLILAGALAFSLSIAAVAQTKPVGPNNNNTEWRGGYGCGGGMGGGGRGWHHGGRGHGGGMGGGMGLLSADEMNTHKRNVFSAKTYKDCKVVQDAHHKLISERAKVQGYNYNFQPHGGMCARLDYQGSFNK